MKPQRTPGGKKPTPWFRSRGVTVADVALDIGGTSAYTWEDLWCNQV
jgi:hypothetical protein